MKRAMLLIDCQNDFVSGSLAIAGAREVINAIADSKIEANLYCTQDCHPPDHCSFKESGGMWPAHCIEGTWGYKIVNELINIFYNRWFVKGGNKDIDSYSAVYDCNGNLNDNGILEALKPYDTIYVCGLAFDYCVKFTAIDLSKELPSSKIVVLKDLTASVDKSNDDYNTDELIFSNVMVINSDEIDTRE